MKGTFMNFTFESQGTNTYLVYAVNPEDIIDTISLGMLTNNKIPGLVPTQFSQMNATKYIKYNVSSRVSVRQFFSGVVNKKRLLGVFCGIINAMLAAEEYMIDSSSIILDLDYIFTDVSTCETILICLPIAQMGQNVDLGEFFKNIVFATKFDQTENCDYVAQIINYLNSTPIFSLTDFKAVLDNIDNLGVDKSEPSYSERLAPVSQPKHMPQLDQNPQPIQSTPVAQTPQSISSPQPIQPIQPIQTSVQPPHPINNNWGNQTAQVSIPTAPVGSVKQVPQIPVPPVSTQKKTKTSSDSQEKEISFFYLMQHYNKENAAAYKAQKEAKKQAASITKAKRSGKKEKAPPVPPSMEFAVPGQAVPQTSSVPPTSPAVYPVTPSVPVGATVSPVQQVAQTPYVPYQPICGQSLNFGETTILGGGSSGETTILSMNRSQAQDTPYIIRLKNREKIPLNKPVFRIGKERSYVDYFVGDNTAISRSHANIITREGKYFVVDTNSTNHTFLNDNIIQSNQEIEIFNGDRIRFANEEFEFRIC